MTTIDKLRDKFVNKDLLEQALTHRSWLNENPEKRESNERLEFLGDAVLEFVVSGNLYNHLPDKEEGFLTALRANIVNTQNLAHIALELDLGSALHLSRGEEQSGGRKNIGLLANTVEAIIGSIYIDRGLGAAAEFIESELLKDLDEKLASPLKDPKSLLQEEVQSKGLSAPRYRVIEESGPDHDKTFKVEVAVNSDMLAIGIGKSKNQAEQEAAQSALVTLNSKK